MLPAEPTNEVSVTAKKHLGHIASVDGLRAVAVLGVVWVHVWAFSGNPHLSLGSAYGTEVDLNRALAVLGNGVDLFFVISGFCMYLAYWNRHDSHSWQAYYLFLTRRWLRIAPAFYTAVAACLLGVFLARGTVPIRELFSHAAFLYTVIPGTGGLAAPFWSLATEWQFYVILPGLIAIGKRTGFWPMVICAIAGCLIIRLLVCSGSLDTQTTWNSQLPMRLVEFMWGICAARLIDADMSPSYAFQGGKGFLIGAIVAYAGRFLMVSEVVNWAGPLGFVSKALAEPVLTLGYAVMLWNAASSPSWFADVLEYPWFQAVGRWSYSLYLWHWWPVAWITQAMVQHYGSTVIVQYLSLTISLAVLLPASHLSYRVLELPYFHGRSRIGTGAVCEARN